MCGLEECNKRGYSEYKSTEGKNYCSIKHLVADKAVWSEEAKATKVSFKVCSLLFVLLCQLNYTLSPFFHFSTTNRSWQTPRAIPSTLPRRPPHFWRRSGRLTMRTMQVAETLTPISRLMRSEGSLRVW